MTEFRFIAPLDVLYLRGNKLFEGAGAHGAALMPPWPSLAAGALRSRMLADAGVELDAFARNDPILAGDCLGEILGTPVNPGSFRIAAFTLARKQGNGIEPCIRLPADIVVTRKELDDALYLEPRPPHPAIRTGAPTTCLPAVSSQAPAKPIGGLWLKGAGFRAYLNGKPIRDEHLLFQSNLWQTDPRLGIALEGGRGTVKTGMLYTAESVDLCEGVGFVAGVAGAAGRVPADGFLRLGGDGHGARLSRCEIDWPEPDWAPIERERRFRIVLMTPGIFAGGWRLPGLVSDDLWQGPDGATARLVAASCNRADVVSGWDLAAWQPKSALRAAETGSVYWFDDFQGGSEALRKLVAEGLWGIDDYPDAQRKAEGFNNVMIAAWPRG